MLTAREWWVSCPVEPRHIHSYCHINLSLQNLYTPRPSLSSLCCWEAPRPGRPLYSLLKGRPTAYKLPKHLTLFLQTPVPSPQRHVKLAPRPCNRRQATPPGNPFGELSLCISEKFKVTQRNHLDSLRNCPHPSFLPVAIKDRASTGSISVHSLPWLLLHSRLMTHASLLSLPTSNIFCHSVSVTSSLQCIP